MSTPKRALNSRRISTGSEAPPETATSMFSAIFSTSTSPPSSAPRSPQYIVGTPAKKVMSSFCSRSTAACGSKRGTRKRVEPEANPAFICTEEPKEWNSGSVTRCRSPVGRTPSIRLHSRALSTRLEWLSSAPLGWPVVPEV